MVLPRCLLLFALIAYPSSFVQGYEIKGPIRIDGFDPIHEEMTERAVECLQAASGAAPLFCLDGVARLKLSQRAPYAAEVGGAIGYAQRYELHDAVRWADDPSRTLGLGKQIARGLITFKYGCKRGDLNITSGLLCSGHYGPLQFMHAMAANDTETYDQTRNNMLQWARFAYDVATDKIPLDKDYCTHMRELAASSPEGADFAKRMLPPDPKRDEFVCQKKPGATGKPWTVGSMFSFRCTNIRSAKYCDVISDPRLIRLAALGSILHMVQDSHSGSHTNRGHCGATPGARIAVSRISCNAVTQFYSYKGQDSSSHSKADQLPEIASSCDGKGAIHDPVTAGARILYLYKTNEPAEKLMKYIDQSVLGVATNVIQQPSAGACFAKTTTAGRPLKGARNAT